MEWKDFFMLPGPPFSASRFQQDMKLPCWTGDVIKGMKVTRMFASVTSNPVWRRETKIALFRSRYFLIGLIPEYYSVRSESMEDKNLI